MSSSLAITLGQRFLSYQSFSEALEDWCIAENFTVRKGKKESDITTAHCAVNGCLFYISAALGGEDGVAVNVLRSEHNCVGSRPVSCPICRKPSIMQRVIGGSLLVTKVTTTEDIINAFQLRWKKTLKPSTAKKAKTIVLQDSDAAHAHQFELLPSYIDAVKKARS